MRQSERMAKLMVGTGHPAYCTVEDGVGAGGVEVGAGGGGGGGVMG
jgi:hypothetical protein